MAITNASSDTRIKTILNGARIIYDFVNPEDEVYLLSVRPLSLVPLVELDRFTDEDILEQKIDTVGNSSSKATKWKELNGRRSMYWGGSLTPLNALVPSPMPSFIDKVYPNLCCMLDQLDLFPALKGKQRDQGVNICLVNEYLAQQGILPHTDGPAYHPLVLTVSLGNHTILRLTPSSSSSDSISILLPPRSLFMLSDELYAHHLHSIDAKAFDTIEELRECINWESWWESGAGGLEGSLICLSEAAPEGDEEHKGVVEEENVQIPGAAHPLFENLAEPIKLLLAKRRFVEQGEGWERGRRISLTFRRVEKLRKAILRF